MIIVFIIIPYHIVLIMAIIQLCVRLDEFQEGVKCAKKLENRLMRCWDGWPIWSKCSSRWFNNFLHFPASWRNVVQRDCYALTFFVCSILTNSEENKTVFFFFFVLREFSLLPCLLAVHVLVASLSEVSSLWTDGAGGRWLSWSTDARPDSFLTRKTLFVFLFWPSLFVFWCIFFFWGGGGGCLKRFAENVADFLFVGRDSISVLWYRQTPSCWARDNSNECKVDYLPRSQFFSFFFLKGRA